jgi:hypothetical protein
MLIPKDRQTAVLPKVLLPAATRRALGQMAKKFGVSESEAVRQLLVRGMDATGPIVEENLQLDAALHPVRVPAALRARIVQAAKAHGMPVAVFIRRVLHQAVRGA